MKAKLLSLPNFYNSNLDLTVGKIYDVKVYSGSEYTFLDDGGDKMVLNKDRFEIAHTSEHLSEHYKGDIEPLDLIESLGALEGFARGNIIKYASRVGKKKGEESKDILKIIDYALILAKELEIPVAEEDILETIQDRIEEWYI